MRCQTEEDCTELVRFLPPTEAALLDWAINLMADVVQLEHLNKMNARNIAMVFAPNMTQVSFHMLENCNDKGTFNNFWFKDASLTLKNKKKKSSGRTGKRKKALFTLPGSDLDMLGFAWHVIKSRILYLFTPSAYLANKFWSKPLILLC